jgi:hypothetical protein
MYDYLEIIKKRPLDMVEKLNYLDMSSRYSIKGEAVICQAQTPRPKEPTKAMIEYCRTGQELSLRAMVHNVG